MVECLEDASCITRENATDFVERPDLIEAGLEGDAIQDELNVLLADDSPGK